MQASAASIAPQTTKLLPAESGLNGGLNARKEPTLIKLRNKGRSRPVKHSANVIEGRNEKRRQALIRGRDHDGPVSGDHEDDWTEILSGNNQDAA